MKTITRKQLQKALGCFESVKNTTARCGYGSSRNQFLLGYENGEVFQSYSSLIGAKLKDGRIAFSDKHDYSNTTSLHTKMWCGYTASERRKMLEEGTALLIVE